MALSLFIRTFLAEEMLEESLTSAGGSLAPQMRKICFYDGSQPITADTAPTTQNLLVRITYDANPLPSSATIGATEASLSANVAASHTYEHLMDGTVTWFRAFTNDDLPIFGGTVGTSNADLVLNRVAVTADQQIHLQTFSVKMPYAV